MRGLAVIGMCTVAILACLWGVVWLNGQMESRGMFPSYAEASSVILSQTPPQFQQNKHVSRSVVPSSGNYHITYRFKDHRDLDREWKVTFPISETDAMIHTFGIPTSMFQPYSVTESVIAQRQRQLQAGLFRQEGNYLLPDYDRMAGYYKGFTRPIAEIARQVLGTKASQDDIVEFLLRFCQDIPYGLPPREFDGRHIGQIFPPAQTLVNLYGDCDSKVVLFASAISHFGDPDMIYVHTPGHLSLAIAGLPKPYQKFYTYKNKKYIYAEPVGPGRLAMGYDTPGGNRVDKVREASIPSEYPQVNYKLMSRETPMPTAPTNGQVTGRWADAEKGQFTFWLNTGDYGVLTVYLNDEKYGELNRFFRSDPECGADGTVSILKPAGTYRFRATSTKGVKWESDIRIQNNQCQLIRLGK